MKNLLVLIHPKLQEKYIMTTYTDCTPLTLGTMINALNTWVRAFQAGLGMNGLGSVSDAKNIRI